MFFPPLVARSLPSRFALLVFFAVTACSSSPSDGFERSAPGGEGGDTSGVLPPERSPKPIFVHDQPVITTLAMEYEAQQFRHIANWNSSNEEVRFNASAVEQAQRDFERARRLIVQNAISREDFLIQQHLLVHSQHEFQISQLRREAAEIAADLASLRLREAGSAERTDLRREIAAKLAETYRRSKAVLIEEKAKADDDDAHAAELFNILVRVGAAASPKEREDSFLNLLAKRKEAIKAGIELKYMDELMAAHAITESKLQ